MRLRFLFVLLLIPLLSFAQEHNFIYLSALRTPTGELMYEMSGNDIIVKTLPGSIKNNKITGKLRKYFGINKKELVSTYTDETLPMENRVEVMQTPIEGSGVKINSTLYLLQTSAGNATGIYFTSLHPRDTLFEREFIDEWLIDKFENLVSDKLYADTIYIGNQMKLLGNDCVWRSPNNVHFRGGQVSWSEFPTFEEAYLNKELSIEKNNNAMVTILAEEELDVIFNGTPTTATRIAYMFNGRGSRLPLIVYYIADNIDGHFISCILSNYGVNRDDYELNPLLEVFMSIPELPYFAWNPFDYPTFENYPEPFIKMVEDRIHLFEAGAGMYIPLGNLSGAFGASPVFHFIFGVPVMGVFAVDLRMQAGPLLNKHEFDFRHDDITERTTVKTFAHVGGRLRYHHKLREGLFLNPYLGIGYNQLITGLETEKSTKKDREYHIAGAFSISGGMILRYKRVGLYLEYNYSDYSRSEHLEKGFGNSALIMGLFYSL